MANNQVIFGFADGKSTTANTPVVLVNNRVPVENPVKLEEFKDVSSYIRSSVRWRRVSSALAEQGFTHQYPLEGELALQITTHPRWPNRVALDATLDETGKIVSIRIIK